MHTVITSGVLGSTATYGYDNADNLTNLPATTGNTTQTYDNADQLTTATNSTTGAQQTFTYDTLGERTSQTDSTTGGKQTYTYDQAGQLASYISASQNTANQKAGTTTPTATYGYDATGLRTDRYVNNLHNLDTYDHTSSIPLLLTDATTSYIYGPNDLPVEQIDATGTVHYYHHDQLGSTRALTDSSGRPTATYNYDAYGNLQGNVTTTATTNPLLYGGQYTDAESGLQYDRARYYDPASGGFISPDPLQPQTREPYSYAQDDPVNFSDPTGLSCGCVDITFQVHEQTENTATFKVLVGRAPTYGYFEVTAPDEGLLGGGNVSPYSMGMSQLITIVVPPDATVPVTATVFVGDTRCSETEIFRSIPVTEGE